MRGRGAGRILVKTKGGVMYHWMGGWGWFWMTFMTVFWVAVLGAVVYAAVRLGQRPPGGKHS